VIKLPVTISAIAAVTLFGLVGLALVAGASPDKLPTGDEPQLGEIPIIDDPGQIILPLDVYVPDAKDRSTVLRAQYRQVGACMERFGFSFDAPPWDETAADSLGVSQPSHYRLYGLLDETHAAEEGYHVSETQSQTERESSEASRSRDYYNVIAAKFGGGTYDGQAIPRGGCMAEAQRVISAGSSAFDSTLPERLSFESWDRSNSDSRVIAAFESWSECMSRSGFSYQTPMDANNDKNWSGETASAAEIAVAMADVACKKQTNLTGIRMAVDAAYQRAEITLNAQELNDVYEGQQRELENAVRLLATN
jgi:hypothetical protein